jgi:hypothetical protein
LWQNTKSKERYKTVTGPSVVVEILLGQAATPEAVAEF